MIRLFSLNAAWALLMAQIIYFMINIRHFTDGSVGLPALLLVGVLFGILFMIKFFLLRQKLFLWMSALFLCLFFIYLCLRIAVDVSDFEVLKGTMIGTTSGIVTYYFMGLACFFAMLEIVAYSSAGKLSLMYSIFLAISCLLIADVLLVDAFLFWLGDVRQNIFLVDSSSGLYQRPGNMIAIVFILLSLILTFLHALSKFNDCGKSFGMMRLFAVALYGIFFVFGTSFSQLIGSNSAAAMIVLIFGATFVVNYQLMRQAHDRVFSLRFKDWLVGSEGVRFFSVLMKSSVVLLMLASVFVLVATVWGGISFEHTRLMGFGNSDGFIMGSLAPRLELIRDNFLTQFGDSPILGNMSVADGGDYAHSVPLSLLTHMGILGSCIFLAYFLYATFELGKDAAQASSLEENVLKYFCFILLITVLIAGTATAFFTWSPLWFMLGACFPPLVFRLYEDGEVHVHRKKGARIA